MAAPSVLLRLLLGLALILNGFGSAWASVQMATAHSMTANETTEFVGSAPCAGQHGSAMMASEAAVDHHGPHEPGHPLTDCCDSSACRCACMHGCSSIVTSTTHEPRISPRDLGGKLLATGRPSPVLPHLIRPPIG